MDFIFPQTSPIFLALAWQQDRIGRIVALTPKETTAGLLWLAMNFPAVCDAMLDKVEYDAIDDPDPALVNPAAPSHRGAAWR